MSISRRVRSKPRGIILKLYGQSGDFALKDAEKLPFADESFDVAYSNACCIHTPDTAEAVREIHRVLRPGGFGACELYHRNSWYYGLKHSCIAAVPWPIAARPNAEDIMAVYVEVNERRAARW